MIVLLSSYAYTVLLPYRKDSLQHTDPELEEFLVNNGYCALTTLQDDSSIFDIDVDESNLYLRITPKGLDALSEYEDDQQKRNKDAKYAKQNTRIAIYGILIPAIIGIIGFFVGRCSTIP